MTTFSLPLFLQLQNPVAVSQLKAVLLEPFFVTAAGLFWLGALAIGAFMSAAVTAYDTVISRNATALRLPHLRGRGAINPLLLRRNDRTRCEEGSHVPRASRTMQALEN
jgi:hypothetical protein